MIHATPRKLTGGSWGCAFEVSCDDGELPPKPEDYIGQEVQIKTQSGKTGNADIKKFDRMTQYRERTGRMIYTLIFQTTYVDWEDD